MRLLIQADEKLNNLLYDNRRFTKSLYLYWRDENLGFNMRSAFMTFNFEGTLEDSEKVKEDEME